MLSLTNATQRVFTTFMRCMAQSPTPVIDEYDSMFVVHFALSLSDGE